MSRTLVRKTMAFCIISILISLSVSSNFYLDNSKATKLNDNSQEDTLLFLESDSFNTLIKSLLTLVHFPSLSTAIVKDNKLVWAKGYGLYDIENNKDADKDTIYLVASISKTFTATAIMQLYEQGYFDLDDDVNGYLDFDLRNPKYPEDKITFRMLLAHQSSIATDIPTYYTRLFPGDLEISGYPYPYLKELLTQDGIHFKPQLWNDYPPGENMYYANIGYGLLGHLVEEISGQSFENYCREHIFDPLEMNDTSFRLMNINISRAAVPYKYLPWKYIPYIHYQILEYPAGGLRTSASDLSRFLISHMNNGTYGTTQILTPESVNEMQKIQYASDTYNFQYGLGFQIWKTLTGLKIGHTGGLDGVATKMVFKESMDIGVIMFFNKEVENLLDKFVVSLIEQLLFQKGKTMKGHFIY
jgi:CubicO group peptidase (beta-lactamase class C family)